MPMLRDARATIPFTAAPLWLWVLAPVRNCALGQDDICYAATIHDMLAMVGTFAALLCLPYGLKRQPHSLATTIHLR
jgi:hypothetical protein